jgi:hypothetical protein
VLAVYRRFLRAEDDFPVVPSGSLPPPPAPHRVRLAVAAVLVALAAAVAGIAGIAATRQPGDQLPVLPGVCEALPRPC